MKQVQNISEFERLKPRETYKKIEEAIEFFKNKMYDAQPIMEPVDQVKYKCAEEALEWLLEIKRNFLSGN